MKLIRSIASLLIITVLSMMLQTNIIIAHAMEEKTNMAVEPFSEESMVQMTAAIEENYEETKAIVGEIEDKREDNIKHYMLEDMTYEAVIYDNPVHYLDNGELKDINNTLVEGTNEVLLEVDLQAERMEQLKESDVNTSLDRVEKKPEETSENSDTNEEGLEEIEGEQPSEDSEVAETPDVENEDLEQSTSDKSGMLNEVPQEDINKSLIKDNKNVLRNVANSFNIELAKKR